MHEQKHNQRMTVACGATRTLRVLFIGFVICSAAQSWAGVSVSLQTDGGAVVSGTNPYHTGFGAVNGLGAGTPSGGVTLLTANAGGGAFYSTPYGIFVSAPPPHTITVTAYITSNFAKLTLYTCPSGGSCATYPGGYVPMSTNSGAPSTVVASTTATPGGNLFQGFLGILVSSANGATAVTGTDSATIHFIATDTTNAQSATADLVLDTPTENIETAVTLGFGQGTTTVNGGAACVLGSSGVLGSDANFVLGTVDGLGVSTPTCGGLVAAVATGATSATYATSYTVTPGFSGFNPLTTGATIALTSAGFTNSSTLTIKEGSSAAGMTTIPASGTTHSFSTVTSKTAIERFMGLTIANNNGGAAARFAGADSALITFTMTVN